MRICKRKLSLLAAASMLSVAPGALAQTTAQTPASAELPGSNASVVDGSSGDIVVTAQKRSERLIDVPASISVLTGTQLEKTGATNLVDYAASVPGMSVNSGGTPGKTNVVLRGISTGDGGALVGTYLDDTPLGSSSGFARGDSFQLDLLPYDIDRVEVLRGPQGTLYGASTMGGLLKYVMRQANPDRFEARGGGMVETTENSGQPSWGVRGMVNAPIVGGSLAIRVSGFYQDNAGWIDNPLLGIRHENSSTQKGGRVALFWQPTDRLTFKASAMLQDIKSNGNAAVSVDATTIEPLIGRYSRNHALAEPFNQRLRYYSLTGTWDAGFATLTSATSWSKTRNRSVVDESAVYSPYFQLFDPAAPANALSAFSVDINLDKFTQELRLASHKSDHFEWLIGGFYTIEHALNQQSLSALNPDRTAIASLTPFAVVYWPTAYREESVFANATYKFTRWFDITGGIRYSHNKQTYDQNLDGVLFGGPTHTGLASGANITTWSASARLRPNDSSTFYARAASGYRPGGPNAPVPGAPAAYAADRLTNYEVGYKALLLDKKLDLELSAFYIDWSGVQVPIVLATGSTTGNGGKASSRGFEVSAQYRVAPGLSVGANSSYTEAHLDSDVPALGALKGDHLPNAARWQAAALIDYSRPVSSNAEVQLGASYRYRGASLTGLESIPGTIRIPAQSVVDAYAGLTFGRFNARIYARNLFNERAYTTFFDPDATGAGLLVPIQPRTIGLSLDVRY